MKLSKVKHIQTTILRLTHTSIVSSHYSPLYSFIIFNKQSFTVETHTANNRVSDDDKVTDEIVKDQTHTNNNEKINME